MSKFFRINVGIQNASTFKTEANIKSVNFVMGLYNGLLEDVKIADLGMITIELVDSKQFEEVIPTNHLVKVCVIYKYFNWEQYEKQLEEFEKDKMLLDFIQETILMYAKQFDWPIKQFDDAYKAVIKSRFNYKYMLLKSKKSKNKQYEAEVWVEMKKGYKLIFVNLTSIKSKKSLNIEVIKIDFTEIFWHHLIDKFVWVNDEEIIITNKLKEINFKINVVTLTNEIFFTPKENDEKYLQDEMILINPETPKADRLKLSSQRLEEARKKYSV